MRTIRRCLFKLIDALMPEIYFLNRVRGSIARSLLNLTGAENLDLGQGVRLGFGFGDMTIEPNCHIGTGCYFNIQRGTPPIHLKQGCWIHNFCTFDATMGATITIGSNVAMGMQCVVWTGSHEIGYEDKRAGDLKVKSISIGDGSWIGLRSNIHESIGNGAIVGTSSTVVMPVPSNTQVVGNPARALPGIKLPMREEPLVPPS